MQDPQGHGVMHMRPTFSKVLQEALRMHGYSDIAIGKPSDIRGAISAIAAERSGVSGEPYDKAVESVEAAIRKYVNEISDCIVADTPRFNDCIIDRRFC